MKIKLLLLTGCNKCNKLKEAVGNKFSIYDYQYCDGESTFCDSIEEATNTSNYPIVLKMLNGNYISEICYLIDSYEDLKVKELPSRTKLVPFYSIDKLIEYVINS